MEWDHQSIFKYRQDLNPFWIASWSIVAVTSCALDPSFFIMLHYPQGFCIPTPLDLLTLLSPSWNKQETFYSHQQTVIHISSFCCESLALFSSSSCLPHWGLWLPEVENTGRINPLPKCFWPTSSFLKWQGRFTAIFCSLHPVIYSFLFLGVFQSVIKRNRCVWLNKSPGNSQIGQR